jgi:hypothetical protein
MIIKLPFTHTTILAFALVLLLSGRSFPQFAPSSDPKKEQFIQDRDARDNGISLQPPKIYDDMSLQIMLNSVRSQLAAVQGVSQSGLLGSIGALTGGSSVQNSFAAQVSGGPSLPQTQLTANGPTSQTQTVTGSTPGVTVTNTGPNQSMVTTTPTPTAPTASLPSGSGFGLPSTFGGNALNTLNEQMQLSYEIANLELLLEGSLSDRLVSGGPSPKPRSTVGFPITINPPPEYKNAVAVVEVEVVAPSVRSLSNEPPAITALLPKERTFNVAAITNNQAAVGAGFVTAIAGGSFSFLHGRSTYYVVQDQDTIALQIPSSVPAQATAFAWQFKPVLGQAYVQPGMRQTFVQLAVPVDNFAGCFGTVKITTYWRRFNKKTGRAGEMIPDSLRTYPARDIPVFDAGPFIQAGTGYEDLGNGQVEVKVRGQFINGTYVRVGNTFYQQGTAGFTFEPKLIRFTAPAADLLKDAPQIVSRDGSEVQLVDPADPEPRPFLNQSCSEEKPSEKVTPPPIDRENCGPVSTQTAVSTLDVSTSLLTVLVKDMPTEPTLDKYLVYVAGHAYGLNDAPITRTYIDGCTAMFQAAVPTQVLASTREIAVEPLLWRRRHTVRAPFFQMPFGSTGDKVVLLQKDDKNATFLLVGNRLAAAVILSPATPLIRFPATDPNDPYSYHSIGKFQLSIKDWKAYKSILLSKSPGEKVEPVPLPNPDDKAGSSSSPLSPKFRVVVAADEADFTGDDLESISAVSYGTKGLTKSLSPDNKTLIVRGLAAAGVTAAPTPKDITFEYQDGHKITVSLDVVNFRVEPTSSASAPPATKP